jgi:hypothetical protein
MTAAVGNRLNLRRLCNGTVRYAEDPGRGVGGRSTDTSTFRLQVVAPSF